MEIIDERDRGFISVWLTKNEQEIIDRQSLTTQLLRRFNSPKCRIVFFLSGHDDLYKNTEGLLLSNLNLL